MADTSRFSSSSSKSVVESPTWIFLQTRVTPFLVFLYLVIAAIGLFASPLLYLYTINKPFVGAYIEHTMILTNSQPVRSGSWEFQRIEPVRVFGYQVAAINGQPVSNLQQYWDALGDYKPSQQITLTVRQPSGVIKDYSLRLQKLPFVDQFSSFILPYLTALIYFFASVYVFAVRRTDPMGRTFAIFSASAALGMGLYFDINSTNQLVLLWTVSLAMTGGALINLSLIFPESFSLVARYPFLRWAGYVPSIILIALALPTIYNMDDPIAYALAWRWEYLYMGVGLLVFIGLTLLRRYTAVSPILREQTRLIFWGALLSFGPIAAWFFATSIWTSVSFNSLLLLPMAIFPILAGYAMIRYRLLNTDYILSRLVLYAALTTLTVLGYGFLVSGLVQIFGLAIDFSNPFLVGFMVFVLAALLNPVRMFLQRKIDTAFFRGRAIYRERQQAFGRELTQVMELGKITSLLRSYIDDSLQPSQLHVFIYDTLLGQYVGMPGEQGKPTTDVRFPASSALVQALSNRRDSIFISELTRLPEMIQADQARILLLGSQVFAPLPGRTQLIGWLALGERRSGEPYSSSDLEFVEMLNDQAALAVERAQVVADLERRVRETNVLIRVAQGASFTISFDDILELISAQANQILPARDFRVTIRDNESGILYHAFYLEDDERLSEYENRPAPTGRGLEPLVVETQRPMITDDYERECRRRGQLPGGTGIYAWMGVPLNAGAETIGVISVASRDPGVVYTEEQRGLLQAIADQASGAIVKARLLEEAERRARQLTMLNEIGVSLTSTLEVRPLLNQILKSATEILNCEAGSLFLVDLETDELVFEVVLGPAATKLVGRRLPPGAGLVGQVVTNGRAMIANDAKRRKEWFEGTDEQTGFDTQDLLAVPMRLQDRIIGVIEVINKTNGAPFTESDQNLLTAFTSQATIAHENARLYTLTDKALAERVEELSVMQRIDRELNASLDIERAMRITLDWALRQSDAEVGLVGAVGEEGVTVVVSQGYQNELERYLPSDDGKRRPLPVDRLRGLKEAIQSGQAQQFLHQDFADDENFCLLRKAQMQLVAPIRREAEVIGVLLLEGKQAEPVEPQVIEFLTRLSDHAAIAIANARLYEEVTEANLAKSRFVSFVAHELKNPMASIKGYTELVASGVAGQVNEMQAGFLATVRANVDRMNTIVSDLNDLTKIQVGNMRLDYRAVRMDEALDEAIRSLRRQIDEKEQVLELSLPADLPNVWADPSRMGQILVNLVSNATKYTPAQGRIYIGSELYKSDDEELAHVDFVHVWVRDTGIGISEADQQKIFQQYFRTDVAKETASGTGLGLNITKSLIEMQGGRIWFESETGKGTAFHFILPVAEAG